MPSRNVVKVYVQDGLYHVYNRGVEKRAIFVDTQDYVMFRHYLRAYLLPPDHPSQGKLPPSLQRIQQKYDLYKRVELLAYCLMPNHFHLVVRQTDEKGMAEFVRRMSNAYVAYFNRRYDRVGSLFQGPYKAALIADSELFLPLTRYVHRNPLELLRGKGLNLLEEYPYSSYAEYLGRRQTDWLRSQVIMTIFPEARREMPGIETYQQYVEDESFDELLLLGDAILELASESALSSETP